MDRVTGSSAIDDGSGNLIFTNGNPGTGQEATILPAHWLNDVQENLCRFIESMGITLVQGDYTQLTAAIVLATYAGKFFTLESASSATWNSNVLTFSSDLTIKFRSEAGARRENVIAAASSPITIADGSCLIFRRDLTNPSPVTLASEALYANLDEGEFCVVAESSLTLTNVGDEVLLFRNNGGKLEVCISGMIYDDGETIIFGSASTKSNPYLPPIGTIIPFYDYNGALTFDTSIWKYCDGSVVDVGGLGPQTLPDTSNRYLVGFGTEGGGDIDTAAWATAAVGNASHQVNLQHSHTVNAHTHAVDIASTTTSADGSHTHTVASHSHTANHDHTLSSAGWARVAVDEDGSDNVHMDAVAIAGWTSDRAADGGAAGTSAGIGEGAVLDGLTDSESLTTSNSSPATDSEADHTHTVNPVSTTSTSTSPGTDSQLSITQSIQPRSIRVRHIMRVA